MSLKSTSMTSSSKPQSKSVELPVVGLYYRMQTQKLQEMAQAVPIEAHLEREPRNIQDKNAVKVVVSDERFAVSQGFHIGYLPRDLAKILAHRLDRDTFPYRTEGWLTEVNEHGGTATLVLKRKPKHKTGVNT